MFSRSHNEERSVGILSNVWVCLKSKIPAINRKYTGNNVCLSSLHVSNESPTARLMFSGSGNTQRLVGILSDGWVCQKSKMAANNRKQKWNDITYNLSLHN